MDGMAMELYEAARIGDAIEVKRLLRIPGVDANAKLKGANGRCPLQTAALEGHAKVVECLLAWPGIDVNATPEDSVEKKTPLHVAAEKGHRQVCKEISPSPSLSLIFILATTSCITFLSCTFLQDILGEDVLHIVLFRTVMLAVIMAKLLQHSRLYQVARADEGGGEVRWQLVTARYIEGGAAIPCEQQPRCNLTSCLGPILSGLIEHVRLPF